MILGLALQVLLLGRLADARVRVHEDPGLRAVDAGVPGAFPRLHPAVGVELGGVLAEVPDVAVSVLRVVVARPLLELAAEVEQVGDHDAAGPVIVLVRCVTVITSREGSPSLTPR